MKWATIAFTQAVELWLSKQQAVLLAIWTSPERDWTCADGWTEAELSHSGRQKLTAVTCRCKVVSRRGGWLCRLHGRPVLQAQAQISDNRAVQVPAGAESRQLAAVLPTTQTDSAAELLI